MAEKSVQAKRKIVIATGFAEEGIALMRMVAQDIVTCDASEFAVASEVRDADAVLLGPSSYLKRSAIETAGRLKHLARVGVGVDRVDVQAATERGIFVTNAPDVSAVSVAEFTMALLLALAKNIPRCDETVRNGKWDGKAEVGRNNVELNGKTHGIVGVGRIGGRVAVRCKGFGMKVIYYKRNRDLEFERSAGVEYVPLATLLKESDTISLHTPLTNETMNLLDRPQFESMKRTALLVNQSRGKVVNEKALVQALKEGLIAGYATDVWENEPPDPRSDLVKLKNTVFSPHLGGGTRESRIRVSMLIAEDVVRVMRGEIPKNLVNREVLQRRSLS